MTMLIIMAVSSESMYAYRISWILVPGKIVGGGVASKAYFWFESANICNLLFWYRFYYSVNAIIMQFHGSSWALTVGRSYFSLQGN